MKNFIKSKKISLKSSTEFNEAWLQNLIAQDPAILGLGDLILKDKERIQPRAGRLDLLLQDTDSNKRYEVELQLGKCDESHIIRTIEYWDIERKRYPNYEHCAVIIAEDITSRFLNVISLFNGNIPLIAIQVDALQIENQVTLHFTKVLDEISIGIEEEEEISTADRAYWESKATPETVKCADRVLEIINGNDVQCQLNYNKPYIGLLKNNKANNFMVMRPKKKWINLSMRRIERSEELDSLLESKSIDFEHLKRGGIGIYVLKLKPNEIERNVDIINHFIKLTLGVEEEFKSAA